MFHVNGVFVDLIQRGRFTGFNDDGNGQTKGKIIDVVAKCLSRV